MFPSIVCPQQPTVGNINVVREEEEGLVIESRNTINENLCVLHHKLCVRRVFVCADISRGHCQYISKSSRRGVSESAGKEASMLAGCGLDSFSGCAISTVAELHQAYFQTWAVRS